MSEPWRQNYGQLESMDLLQAHGAAMATFDRAVTLIESRQWYEPTPCTAWTVYDLVNHLVAEQLWVPPLLDGASVEELGDQFDGDQLGTDPKATWQQAAQAAREAWLAPDVLDKQVQLSSGLTPATEYCWEMTTDLAVHGWDLATAIGVDNRIDPQLSRAVLNFVKPKIKYWQGSGLFADSIPVPANASDQDKLLGLLGRQPGCDRTI